MICKWEHFDNQLLIKYFPTVNLKINRGIGLFVRNHVHQTNYVFFFTLRYVDERAQKNLNKNKESLIMDSNFLADAFKFKQV